MSLKLRRFSRDQAQRTDNGIVHSPERKPRRATTDGALLFLTIAKDSTDMVPLLKGLLGGVNTIIEICSQFRSNEEDWKGLVEHIEALCTPIRRFGIENNQSTSVRPEVEEAIEHLATILDEVYSQVLRMKDRREIMKLIQTKEDTKTIAGIRQRLTEAFQRVHLSLHISNTEVLREIQQVLQTVSHFQQTLQDGTGSKPDAKRRDSGSNAVLNTKLARVLDSHMFVKKLMDSVLAPLPFFFFFLTGDLADTFDHH